MKCINFDERFADFTAKWMKEHRGEYKTYDEMEDDLPRVYTEFLNMPAKWLDGVTPGAYFTQFEDAKDLVDWMVQYCQKDIPVPDMLMEQIQAVGDPPARRKRRHPGGGAHDRYRTSSRHGQHLAEDALHPVAAEPRNEG